MIPDSRAQTYVACFADAHSAAHNRSRSDLRIVAYYHVVFDDSAGIDDAMLPYQCPRVDDHAGEYNRSFANSSGSGNCGILMNDCSPPSLNLIAGGGRTDALFGNDGAP